MTPLETILNWFDSLDYNIKLDVSVLSTHFHIDKHVRAFNVFDNDKRIENFRNYINEPNLNNKDIVSRALVVSKLISFSISDKSTEDSWTKALDFNLEMISQLKSDGEPFDYIEQMLQNMPERKAKWLTSTSQWNSLLENQLSDKSIKDWYFSQRRT